MKIAQRIKNGFRMAAIAATAAALTATSKATDLAVGDFTSVIDSTKSDANTALKAVVGVVACFVLFKVIKRVLGKV